jgi:hypothetical protein
MNQDKIERYLANQMTPDEKGEFELGMNQDAQLKKEILELQKVIEQLKLQERHVLKSRLINLEKNIVEQEQVKKPIPYAWILMGVLLVIAVILIWNFNNRNQPVLSPDKDDNFEIDSNSTLVTPHEIAVINEQLNPPQPEIKENKSQGNSEELFAAHFEPYTDEALENELRGNEEKSGYEIFKHYYINERYEKALLVLDTLDFTVRNRDQVLLLKAIALMATHKSNTAIPVLEKVVANRNSIYQKDGYWYLALCYLMNGDIPKTKSILKNRLLQDDLRARQLMKKF